MDQIFWPYILCSFRALKFPFLSTEVGFSPISKAWAKEVHAIVNETMLLKVLDETTDTFEKKVEHSWNNSWQFHISSDTLHRERLSRASLPICKNSPVIAFCNLIYQLKSSLFIQHWNGSWWDYWLETKRRWLFIVCDGLLWDSLLPGSLQWEMDSFLYTF